MFDGSFLHDVVTVYQAVLKEFGDELDGGLGELYMLSYW